MKKRLVVGVSGASGAPLAIELLQQLKYRPEVETHLILTKGGEMTLHQEAGMTTEELFLWQMWCMTMPTSAQPRPAEAGKAWG